MNKAALLIALVAAGAGFGVGHLTGTSTSAEPSDITLDGATQDERVVTKTRTLMSGSDGPTLAATARPAVQLGLEAVLEALPTPTRELGNGTITGEVVTEAGEPLAGVQIMCTPRRKNVAPRMPRKGPEFEALPLEERIQFQVLFVVENARWNEVNKTEAISGADGSFALTGIADLEHRARASMEGWTIRTQDHSSRVKSGDKLKFVATRVTGIRLEVFGPDGKAPESAQATLKAGRGTRGGSWRPERTLVQAKPGHYELTVKAGRHEELRGGPIDVEITKEESAPIRVDLTLAPVVLLDVAFPEGEEMRGKLYVMKSDGPEEPSGALLKSRGKEIHRYHRRGSTQTISDLDEGWHAVGFSRSEAFDVIDMLQVKAGVLEHTLTVPPLARDRYVIARLTGSDGDPVVGARISSGYESSTGSRSGGSTFSDRGNGEYMVMHGTHAPDSESTYWVAANSTTHGIVRAEYRKAGGQTLDLQFEAPAQAHFTVEGATAKRAISIAVSTSERGSSNSHKCDADGKVTVQPLQPGTYSVGITVGERFASEVSREKVTIRSGKNNIALALPTLYSVTVRGGERRVMVTAKRDPSKPPSRRHFYRHAESVNGEALVDGIPAGEYTAQSGRKTATFTLPGTSVVTLEARK